VTPDAELEELTRIYVDRGLDRDLAEKMAHQLTEQDALGSHARDELGISGTVTARPLQAAPVSALTFAFGAVVPLIVVLDRAVRGGIDGRPLRSLRLHQWWLAQST